MLDMDYPAGFFRPPPGFIDVDQLDETRRLNAPVVGTGPFGIALSAQGDIVYVTDSDAVVSDLKNLINL